MSLLKRARNDLRSADETRPLLASSPLGPSMSNERRRFTEKEYFLLVLVGVALLMAVTGVILVFTAL